VGGSNRCPRQSREHQQDDAAEVGNNAQKNKSSAAIQVMKPANGNSEGWKKECQQIKE